MEYRPSLFDIGTFPILIFNEETENSNINVHNELRFEPAVAEDWHLTKSTIALSPHLALGTNRSHLF